MHAFRCLVADEAGVVSSDWVAMAAAITVIAVVISATLTGDVTVRDVEGSIHQAQGGLSGASGKMTLPK